LRGAAAHLWWAYYKVMKGREGVMAGQAKAKPAVGAVPRSKK
jgi:DNA-3-methyladenine glycosylase II